MQIPYIKQVETVTDLLDLLGDKTEMGKRLKLLKETEDGVNKLLKKYEGFDTADKYRQQADNLLSQAKVKLEEAHAYYTRQADEADKLLSEAQSHKADVQARLALERKNLVEWEAALRLRDTKLTQMEQENKAFAASTEKMDEAARQLYSEALAIKEEYEDRLKRIREATI